MERTELEDSFLTVAEVAEVLKLNQQTVRNWIDQGSLPALRVGRRVRIRRSDFERLLADGSDGGRTAGGSAAAGTVPDADDFWGGEPVGLAEPGPGTRPSGEPPGQAGEPPGHSGEPRGESDREFGPIGAAEPPATTQVGSEGDG